MEFSLHKCCCCLSPRIGALIIGFFYLGTSLFAFVDRLAYEIQSAQKSAVPLERHSVYGLVRTSMSYYPTCLEAIFGVYLIYGTIRSRSYFCLSFLIIQTLYFCLTMVTALQQVISPSPRIRPLEGALIAAALLLYCAFIVYNYYRSLPKQKFINM